MKIITTTAPVSTAALIRFLEERINPAFQEKRRLDIAFNIREVDNGVEIYNTEFYDGFLFRFEIEGNVINIIKSEHYTDDVNILTLEEIINMLLLDYPGRENIVHIGEES